MDQTVYQGGIVVRTCACLLLACSALAQEPIQIIVTAEGRHGRTAPEVGRGDVQVYEGKERLAVADWIPLQGAREDLELCILIDDSSSGSLGSQLEDIRAFVRSQKQTTAVAIGYMRNGTTVFAQAFTRDHQAAAKSVRLPLSSLGAEASPYFALEDLIKKWPSSEARHEVIMISDGIDPYGGSDLQNPYVQTAIEKAQRAGIVVYSIYASGVGHMSHSLWSVNIGQSFLSQLSEGTGGESYTQGFQTPISLTPFLDEIEHRLNSQYRLSFIPKAGGKPGLQRIRLRTELPDLDLAAQERVYVP
jgi:VWFA-related protein